MTSKNPASNLDQKSWFDHEINRNLSPSWLDHLSLISALPKIWQSDSTKLQSIKYIDERVKIVWLGK